MRSRIKRKILPIAAAANIHLLSQVSRLLATKYSKAPKTEVRRAVRVENEQPVSVAGLLTPVRLKQKAVIAEESAPRQSQKRFLKSVKKPVNSIGNKAKATPRRFKQLI